LSPAVGLKGTKKAGGYMTGQDVQFKMKHERGKDAIFRSGRCRKKGGGVLNRVKGEKVKKCLHQTTPEEPKLG